MNNRLILNALLLLAGAMINQPVAGQSFRLRAEVEAIGQSGYHRIHLPPDVVGRLNANLTDIRLYDQQQREVPYLLTRESPTPASGFVAYPIVSQTVLPRVSTTFVLRNPTKRPINSLDLLIKNTNLRKKASLGGSNDARQWFGIDDDIWLAPTNSAQSTAGLRQINFPLSDYEFYRLTINDSLDASLNVLQIGYFTKKWETGHYDPIPGITFTQQNSYHENRTDLQLSRSSPARVDKLSFRIQAPAKFLRRAELGYFVNRRPKRGRTGAAFEPVYSFELSSADSNVIYVNHLTTKGLHLRVDNQDNVPLTFGDVRAAQLTTYLTANLTAGGAYELRYAADNVGTPAYDLTYFKNTLPDNPPVVEARPLDPEQAGPSGALSLLNNRGLMWGVLGVVLVLLGIFSYRMMREVEQRRG